MKTLLLLLGLLPILVWSQTFDFGDTLFRQNSSMRIYAIQWEPGTAKLLPSSYPHLDSLVTFLEVNPKVVLEIGDHSDPGKTKKKKTADLSQERANVIQAYLTGKGIDSSRLTPIGYGIGKPLVPAEKIAQLKEKEDLERANAMNTRTEYKIVIKTGP